MITATLVPKYFLNCMLSMPTDLLEHSSDATGAVEVVAGVSGILALHHLQ